LFILCGGLSWLFISFLLHYHIISYRTTSTL